MAAALPPRSDAVNSHDFRPVATGRRARSTKFVSAAKTPFSVKRCNTCQVDST